MTDNDLIRAFADRYKAAAHGMQSGVALQRQKEIERGIPEDERETGPKHLRVGVNSAMADHGALVELLISKNVLTREEYFEAITNAMERERASYEEALSKALGANITLG